MRGLRSEAVPVDRALVVDAPWIDMILDGRKDWEMRTRATRVRGAVGLIRKGSGTVVGVARVAGCLPPLSHGELLARGDRHGIGRDRIDVAVRGGWTTPWVLADAVRLAVPVPYAHPQGAVVWVRLAPAVADAVTKAVTGILV